ncbi:DNA-binding protein [Micromonospora sp. NPDC049679]|uniref:DNA-binding protein n=1 Tax=Micromonospora sp. NPDC049679 TaxID=3155920 RepID=UPI00340DF2E1
MASWMGQTQAQLSRLENGPALRHIDRLAAWARLLDMPQDLLWIALPPGTSPNRDHHARGNAREMPSPEAHLHFIRSLRSADRQVGGGHLYASVTAYLADTGDLSPQQLPAAFAPKQLLAATASLNEMAGWMAHDSAAAGPARKHLYRAMALAGHSGDHQLAAQASASISHFACHHGNSRAAISFAQDGLRHLGSGPPHGRLQSKLLAMQARGLASGGRVAEAATVLAEAEKALQRETCVTSDWLSPFDTASFAIEAARFFLRIGDLAEARRRLEDALAHTPAVRVRSRAFAQLMLVTALLGRGELDEACSLVEETLGVVAGLGSAIIGDHLDHVGMLLAPHTTTSPHVTPLLDRLRSVVREQAWIASVHALHEATIQGEPADG